MNTSSPLKGPSFRPTPTLKAAYTVRLCQEDAQKLASLAAHMQRFPTTLASELLEHAIRSIVVQPSDARQMTIDDLVKAKAHSRARGKRTRTKRAAKKSRKK